MCRGGSRCLTHRWRRVQRDPLGCFEDGLPDLLIGLAADLQHLLALELQLLGQGADVLVEGVDLQVQLGDVVLPPGHLLLQLGDPAQQLALLQDSGATQLGGIPKANWPVEQKMSLLQIDYDAE